MKIKGKPCIVFDIECLKNIFTCTCKDTESNTIITFEISERKNELDAMCDYFLYNDFYFVGYNNIHFDNPIVNYCIEYRNHNKSTRRFTESIYTLAHLIMDRNDSGDRWKKWKYGKYFKSIDLLTMMYSKALRVSLKEMQVTMHYKNVEEFVADWHADLPLRRFDELISYNINDVESTTELLYRCQDRLELRIGIEQEYKINCLSLDDVNLGMQVLAAEYMRETGITKRELESTNSPCDSIDLEQVILPFIKFSNPVLAKALKEMKSQHRVSPGRKGYEKTFLFGGMKTTIGVGGIHGDCGTTIIKPENGEKLLDWDVTSLYPSLMIEHGFYPPHLGEAFIRVYSRIRALRIKAKKEGNKLINECFKFVLNGLSGNLQNPYSWAYSPFTVMQIRINGQLLLLMLAEKLLELGCKLKQINTDGILFISPSNVTREQLNVVQTDWEKLTKLGLEEEEFTSFYQLAINDYFGTFANGNIKEKGFFITQVKLGKGLTPKIIPKAVIDYFVHGTPVEQTIRECKDIRDFLQSEKTGKQWNVEYNDTEQQHTNRFYVCNSGYYLWKWKLEDEHDKKKPIYYYDQVVSYEKTGGQVRAYHNMLKGYGVRLLNRFPDDLSNDFDKYDINYTYYVIQATKVIEQLKPSQLNLFDFD